MDYMFSIAGFSKIFILFAFVFVLREFFTFRKIKIFKYLLSPLVTALCAGFVLLSMSFDGINPYRIYILVSLILSLIADTMLMIEETDLMRYGIIYFLAAHVFYIIAFSGNFIFEKWNLLIIVFLLVLIGIMIVPLKRNSGGMFVPIVVYMVAISVMVFFAVSLLNFGMGLQIVFAAAGSVLFMVSDCILAVNQFIRKIPHSSVSTWAAYGPAQLLIAWSCF